MIRTIKRVRSLVHEIVSETIMKKGKESKIRIAYFGYWISHKKIPLDDWFKSLIEFLTNKTVSVSWYKTDLIITSVFDNYSVLKILLKKYNKPSIFFSGENLNIETHLQYKDYLKGLPTLALGFDYDSSYAHRFPLWLIFIFDAKFVATASLEDIRAKLHEIESRSLTKKGKFAAMIASHNGHGAVLRSEVTNALSSVCKVSCAGKLLHNDNSLQNNFNDDKKEYLKDFLFNICLENTCSDGYVTEKLFEAFEAGCIPIYWGDNNPEPDILNPKRIIFWKENSSNDEVVDRIRQIYENDNIRKDFFQTPIFVNGADEVIFKYFIFIRREVTALLKR